jgi:ABC-2 type transport system ATP-binding protein
MIESKDLTKRFGEFLAVDRLSFSVEPGQVLGFLGPNGAGKSTTMKMLAGFLSPTSGSAKIAGFDIENEPLAAKRALGYLPEGAPSYGEMTVAQFLSFIADVRQLEGSRKAERTRDVIDRLELGGVLDQPIDTLSKGFKRRVGLAQAIIHDPKVLIMDEPTDGLDPNQKAQVRQLINAIAHDKTIIISTHILEEVEAVCARAIIIARGRIVADDTPAKLEAMSRYHHAVTLHAKDLSAVRAGLETIGDVASIEVDAATSRISAFPKSGKQLFAQVSEMLRARQLEIDEIRVERGRLDEVFRNVTQAKAA